MHSIENTCYGTPKYTVCRCPCIIQHWNFTGWGSEEVKLYQVCLKVIGLHPNFKTCLWRFSLVRCGHSFIRSLTCKTDKESRLDLFVWRFFRWLWKWVDDEPGARWLQVFLQHSHAGVRLVPARGCGEGFLLADQRRNTGELSFAASAFTAFPCCPHATPLAS